ncbi:DUF421 domain-containing protein [Planosporangium thailandense]|uniref:DUF421 domain-containing protein n=2 Tax=Planosporangium thailandense TaxID=765197 RepID=A0ABX0Y8V5_9ACTN|nr:DUF421 domain-containing protein [Planosporangium thailandense]
MVAASFQQSGIDVRFGRQAARVERAVPGGRAAFVVRSDRVARAVSIVFGSPHDLWWVVVKTLLLYATAVICFRVGERRTLAEMSAFDFIAAVAAGAIVGRVPNAHDAGYLAGAATLLTVLLAHRLTARLRFRPLFARLIDHPPRLLVAEGKVLDGELRRSGLTRQDLYGLLRQHGVDELSSVRFVVFEQRGQVSVVRRGAVTTDTELLRDLL